MGRPSGVRAVVEEQQGGDNADSAEAKGEGLGPELEVLHARVPLSVSVILAGGLHGGFIRSNLGPAQGGTRVVTSLGGLCCCCGSGAAKPVEAW